MIVLKKIRGGYMGLNIKELRSGDEKRIAKEVSRFYKDCFNMSPEDTYMYVTARISYNKGYLRARDPFKCYTKEYLLGGIRSKDLEVDIVEEYANNLRYILDTTLLAKGDLDWTLPWEYFHERMFVKDILARYNIEYKEFAKYIEGYKNELNRLVSEYSKTLLDVDGTNLYSIFLRRRLRKKLMKHGYYTVESLYNLYYTGDEDLEKELTKEEKESLNDALKLEAL